MIEEIISWLASDNGFAVHLSVYILLLLGSIGFPIPEDIPLILSGVAASKGIVNLEGIFVTCYLAVILSDQVIFFAGYSFGQKMLTASTRSSFFPAITENRVNEIREGLRRKKLLYIFIGRHLFPVRTVTFLTAGALRIPFLEFLFADALAALISVFIMVGLGFFLGSHLTPETTNYLINQAHIYILYGIVFILFAWLIKRIYFKKKLNPVCLELKNSNHKNSNLASLVQEITSDNSQTSTLKKHIGNKPSKEQLDLPAYCSHSRTE